MASPLLSTLDINVFNVVLWAATDCIKPGVEMTLYWNSSAFANKPKASI